MRKLIFTLLLATFGAHAGQWAIGSNTGAAGAAVPVSVSLTGDGQTRDGELTIVFDDSRLRLPVSNGVIPGAGLNSGTCIRTASNKVQVIRLTGTGSPALPTTPTVLCNLPFTVLNPAPVGRAALTGTKATCFSESTSVACTVSSGAVTVSGAAPTPVAVATPQFKYLFVMLSTAPGTPTVQQLSNFNFSSGQPRPLVGLNAESPLLVSGMLLPRATGDFAAYLAQYPDTARAKLERYVLVQYRTSANLATARAALTADQYVAAVYDVSPAKFSSLDQPASALPKVAPAPKSIQNQYHLGVLKMPEAWTYAGGWGLIGNLDSGLYTEHSDLKSFSGPGSVGGSFIPGGNFLSKYALDVGNQPISVDDNVDEAAPVIATASSPAAALICDELDGVPDGFMTPTFAGHGTHTSGTMVANAANGNDIDGVCKNCGLAMHKITYSFCSTDGVALVLPDIGPTAIQNALTFASQVGVQTINMSFGIQFQAPINNYCASNLNDPYCLALQFAKENEVVLSTASGNNRQRLQFPAREPNTVGVGGIDAALALWDESPGNFINCPFGNDSECGSNYTYTLGEKRQEIVAPSKAVRAPIYPGKDWNVGLGCGDSVGDDSSTDGIGLCTGTSMSAPQATALYGLLRSINPLLLAGDPETSAFGVRDVVTSTTDRVQLGLPWTQQFGYGIPDAPAAARKILGTVRGDTVKNRATPLFALYGSTTTDYAVMATPQNAMSLIRYAAAAYATVPTSGNFIGGAAIPGYTEFPHEVTTPSPVPQARAYVLTTEFAPVIDQNRVVTPLYLLDRERNWPLNCSPLTPPPGGCNTLNRDFILLTSISQMNSAVAAGYAYRGLQGYVFTTQATGTQALYLKCKTADDDCAIFLESDRIAFEFAGYTSTFPSASSTVIGYAYPTGDSDGDGLVDAMEYAVGTNPNSTDSDGDGLSDSVEMPMNGVSNSDPCSGPSITCLAPAPLIFANGFE